MNRGPTLILVVEKGPRRGESVQCIPGGHIRIGRVVRGNTFTIKDPSISQKHVFIEFTSASGGGGSWTLTDLDTSNGTFLNSAPLDPLLPAALKHGDIIKIGEYTSITIRIVELEGEEEQPEALSAAVTAAGRPKRAAAARKGRGEASRLVAEVEEFKIKDSAAGVAVRRTGRARRNVAAADFTSQPPKDATCPEEGPVEAEEDMEGPAAPELEKKPALPPGRAGRRRGAMKVTFREAIDGGVGVEHDGVIVLDTPDRHQSNDKPDISINQEPPISGLAANGAVGSQMENRVSASASAAASSCQPAAISDLGEDVDLENMTLGQWFDRMEKVLPLMLKDACDEIVADIKEKTKRFNAYALETAKDGR